MWQGQATKHIILLLHSPMPLQTKVNIFFYFSCCITISCLICNLFISKILLAHLPSRNLSSTDNRYVWIIFPWIYYTEFAQANFFLFFPTLNPSWHLSSFIAAHNLSQWSERLYCAIALQSIQLKSQPIIIQKSILIY